MADEKPLPAPGLHAPTGPGAPSPHAFAPILTRRAMVQALNAGWLSAGLRGLAPGGAALAAQILPRGAAAAAAPETGPRAFHTIENVWIPMPDGTKLAARVWIPAGADKHPVPALFNYCPYYAHLMTRGEDDARFSYFAARGYAVVRADIRGSGLSEGRPMDEYVQQEQDDGVEIIAWIARQPWCNGKVGMEGLSWSGFSSLQVAARRPPALKAIITHCSTDDRYADDAHFKGGCIIHDMFDWGTAFLAFQGQAQDPAIVGEGWRTLWRQRLEAVDFNLGNWMTHQHRDAFWKHASVCEDYGRIACPVYAIGGWVDGYKNAVFRLLANLKVPRKGLVGPWTHIYPHQGVPGPAIGYLQEALRWWDHWLKGVDTGILSEPLLRVYMQDGVALPGVPTVPGRWVAEERWPSPRIGIQTLFLNPSGRLGQSAGARARCELNPVQTVGGASGNWCPSGAGGSEDLDIEIALDQRVDDARSLVFDTDPLPEAFEILGAPAVTLSVAVDKPVAFLAVRLNEVMPTGESRRITYAILNLCHRNGSERPEPLEPGKQYSIRIPLDYTAHRFHAGSLVRVSISTTYWPLMLPSPEPVKLSLWTGLSSLELPMRPPRPEDNALHAFEPPIVPPVPEEVVSSTPGKRIVELDIRAQQQEIHHRVGDGVVLLKDVNTRIVSSNRMQCRIHENDPNGATMEYRFAMGWERGDLRPHVEATSTLVTAPTEFLLTGEIRATDGKQEVFTRKWVRKVQRRLV